MNVFLCCTCRCSWRSYLKPLPGFIEAFLSSVFVDAGYVTVGFLGTTQKPGLFNLRILNWPISPSAITKITQLSIEYLCGFSHMVRYASGLRLFQVRRTTYWANRCNRLLPQYVRCKQNHIFLTILLLLVGAVNKRFPTFNQVCTDSERKTSTFCPRKWGDSQN